MKNIKVCILDYGSGNVASVYNLLNRLNYKAIISNNSSDIKDSSHIILPGVGTFGASIKKLEMKLKLIYLKMKLKLRKNLFLEFVLACRF